MQPARRFTQDSLPGTGRDNLAWHPATRSGSMVAEAAANNPEELIAAQLRIVARLEEETHTLTSQLGYIQTLLQQTRETLALLNRTVQWVNPGAKRPGVQALSVRLARARQEENLTFGEKRS